VSDFDPSKLPGGNFSFPSTGDPERDSEIAARIRRDAGAEAEGICPNGCGPITIDSPTEKHCERCGFIQQSFRLGAW
jgi:hypothetical protein